MTGGLFFQPREFTCKDGTAYPDQWADRLYLLIAMLDRIRAEFGAPLLVVSGYRTPAYNRAKAGAKASLHVEGRAADIAPICAAALKVAEVERLNYVIEAMMDKAQLPAIGGIGYYPGRWVHVDTRVRKAERIARWNGVGFGSEVTA